MEHAVFAAFLVVDDELDGDAGAAGPGGVGHVTAITNEIARVGFAGDRIFWRGHRKRLASGSGLETGCRMLQAADGRRQLLTDPFSKALGKCLCEGPGRRADFRS